MTREEYRAEIRVAMALAHQLGANRVHRELSRATAALGIGFDSAYDLEEINRAMADAECAADSFEDGLLTFAAGGVYGDGAATELRRAVWRTWMKCGFLPGADEMAARSLERGR